MIRTGADKLFDKFQRPNAGDWNQKMGTDLLKKLMRGYVKEVYMEKYGEKNISPEN